MHCGRLEFSANLGSCTIFNQMQYHSNFHTQVVCWWSDIVDNDNNFFEILYEKLRKVYFKIKHL